MSKEMHLFELTEGKKLAIGDQIRIKESSEYYSDWMGVYVVIGMNWSRDPDTWNITIAKKDWINDGGTDGWTLDEIQLRNTTPATQGDK